MADLVFLKVYNKANKTTIRIAEHVWNDPKNATAFQHCELLPTTKVEIVEGEEKKKKPTKKKVEEE